MPQLIQNIRNSIEVLLSIKNDQGNGDLTDNNDGTFDDHNANGLGTPTSMPFKKAVKKDASKGRKTLAEKGSDPKFDKDLNSIKSQSLFSNYYSGKKSTFQKFNFFFKV